MLKKEDSHGLGYGKDRRGRKRRFYSYWIQEEEIEIP
jgi:hypothetical protein